MSYYEEAEHRFLGYGIGKYGNDTWNSYHHWNTGSDSSQVLSSVQAAFIFLLIASTLSLSLLILFLRKSRRNALRPMPLIMTVVAMLSMAVAMVHLFVLQMIIIYSSGGRNWYNLCDILGSLFEPVSYTIMFYVFYAIVHIFRDRVFGDKIDKKKAKVITITRYMHWTFVGMFAALVIVDWSWLINWRNRVVVEEIVYYRYMTYWDKIYSTRCILFWLAAWEIVAWAFYVGLKASQGHSKMNLKMSLYFFVAASGFFLAINFQNFVWAVVYYLKDNEVPTDINKSKGTIQVVLRFFFDSGFFFAITLCYWRFPEPDSDINNFENAEIDHGIINRTQMQPREAEGSQITAADAAKEKIIHEVSDSNGLLEADNSNGIPDKKHLLEADSGNVILEADSKGLVEKA